MSHKQLTFKEHARERALYAGSAISSPHELWLWEPVMVRYYKTIESYGDAMLNCVDELIVNALDHWTRSTETPTSEGGPVRNIWISLDKISGVVSIMNDGPGIPCVNDWPGRTTECYMPEAICSQERMGSNFNDTIDKDRITGGLNGLGIKVAFIAGDYAGVETTDIISRKHYYQTFRERLEFVDPPILMDLPRNATETRNCSLRPEQLKPILG